MQFQLQPDIRPLDRGIRYTDRILLMGSCFTEHIGDALAAMKFRTLRNPNGILFSPDAVCRAIDSYLDDRGNGEPELFLLEEVWHSWQHHSRFSHTDRDTSVAGIHASRKKAHDFLREAEWLILTFGSSFFYSLTPDAAGGLPGTPVANCHRAPASWFSRRMLEIVEITELLEHCLLRLREVNPACNVLFTISPVRHIRDGVVDNNRSKARLIEAVHALVARHPNCFYFPAYELVVDVLRDYRFYDIDLVHPNYAATEFVMEQFMAACVDSETREILQRLKPLVLARKHRPLHPGTRAQARFMETNLEKALALQEQYPFLDLQEEIDYFAGRKGS